MDEGQAGVSKVLYDYMLAAHKDQFGEASVKMRHYLQGLAGELATRMGLTRSLLAQSEDSATTVMSVPVEEKWDEARRDSQTYRTPDGRPTPIRRWREVQIIKSSLLPTEKGWRSGGPCSNLSWQHAPGATSPGVQIRMVVIGSLHW